MTASLQALSDAGVSVWLDDLSRQRIATGSLDDLVTAGVTGVTTNPTIFATALTGSDNYAVQLHELMVCL